jgi:hypothetical protein
MGSAGTLHLAHSPAAALTFSILTAGYLQLEHKRKDFISSGNISGNRKLYSDTHTLVYLLKENGFTTQEAEVSRQNGSSGRVPA